MRTEIDLDAAAAAGIIGEDQAIALRNFQAQRDGMTGATSEKFQIFGGYADLVVAIGAAMVLIAVAIAAGILVGPRNTGGNLLGSGLCAGTALALFRLTERINLRASPAMGLVLTSAFAEFGFFAILVAIFVVYDLLLSGSSISRYEEVFLFVVIIAHCASMRRHWLRFGFPPTPALVTGIYAFAALAAISELVGMDTRWPVAAAALLIASGAMIAGIWWDLTDIRRETERSQTAFWLHCVAGVLMSRALFSLLTGSQMVDGELIFTGLSFDQFPWVLAMVLGAAFLSLLLDRRSLLVGSLLPTVGIFDVGNNGEAAIMAGFALAGTALIFFSTSWVKLRTGLLALLPTRMAAQLPRTSLMAEGQRPTRRHKELWRLR